MNKGKLMELCAEVVGSAENAEEWMTSPAWH